MQALPLLLVQYQVMTQRVVVLLAGAGELPGARSFHKAVVLSGRAGGEGTGAHETGAKASAFELLVLGGAGASGSVGDPCWRAHGSLCAPPLGTSEEPADSQSAAEQPAGRAVNQGSGGGEHAGSGGAGGAADPADVFLKKLELEDFFEQGSASATISGADEPPRPAAPALGSTVSTSSMEAWPTLSPEQLLPSADADDTRADVSAGTGGTAAGGGASTAGQLEAAVQLCAQLRDTVATTQQSEAKYRAQAAAHESQIQRLKDAREVDEIRSNQLIEEAESRARWGGRPLTVERAKQRYNPDQAIDAQALPLGDIEAVLSAVKALKLAEVERWQTTVRGGGLAVAGSSHRRLPALQQPLPPDLSFLLYEDADAVPLVEVAGLVAEYERLCAAEAEESEAAAAAAFT